VIALLAANALYFVVGAGLLPLLRIARGSRELVERLPLAYPLGVAATGILAAHLALIDVPLGLVELVVLAAVVGFVGFRRLGSGSDPERGSDRELPLQARVRGQTPGGGEAAVRGQTPDDPRDPPEPRDPLWSRVVGGVALLLAIVLLLHAWRTYEVRPLLEWDGWAIWGTKARALYEFGGATGPVFTSEAYLPLQHPLLLPALEATDFRALGAYDPTLVHVQLALLAIGFLLGLTVLLRDRVPAFLLGLSVLAILAAEPVLKQLSTNLADVPLALFVALGLVGAGRWLAGGERWPLVAGAAFLGAAALTKSEGMFFVLAAFLALLPVAWRRWRELGLAALAVAATVAPWRLFVALHGLPLVEYRFRNAFSPGYLSDHSDRVGPAARGLAEEIFTLDWGLLLPLFAVALLLALVARRYALAAFAATWCALSFLGLLVIYWISVIPIELALVWSADRTVITIVVGAAALAPLLAGAGATSAAARGRR
jgi:hypothetical protein